MACGLLLYSHLGPQNMSCLIAIMCLIICLYQATINFEEEIICFVYHCISRVWYEPDV